MAPAVVVGSFAYTCDGPAFNFSDTPAIFPAVCIASRACWTPARTCAARRVGIGAGMGVDGAVEQAECSRGPPPIIPAPIPTGLPFDLAVAFVFAVRPVVRPVNSHDSGPVGAALARATAAAAAWNAWNARRKNAAAAAAAALYANFCISNVFIVVIFFSGCDEISVPSVFPFAIVQKLVQLFIRECVRAPEIV